MDQKVINLRDSIKSFLDKEGYKNHALYLSNEIIEIISEVAPSLRLKESKVEAYIFNGYRIISFLAHINDAIRPQGYIYPVYNDKIGPFSNAQTLFGWLAGENKGLYTIHQVERISDGVRFTVGDKIAKGKFVVDREFSVIDKIYINEHDQLSFLTNKGRAPRTFVFGEDTKEYIKAEELQLNWITQWHDMGPGGDNIDIELMIHNFEKNGWTFHSMYLVYSGTDESYRMLFKRK